MSAVASGPNPLERRYRLLLRAYPAGYRAEYQDEMLGVLMDTAEPGRRWPAPAEALSLLAGAVGGHLRRAFAGPVSAAWRDTAAVAAAILPVLLLTERTRELMFVAWPLGWSDYRPPVGPSVWGPVLAWALAVAAALAGPRRLAVGAVWAAAAVEVGLVVRWCVRYGFTTPLSLWPLLCAVAAAVALTVGPGARHGLRILGRRRSLALVLLAAFAVAIYQVIYRTIAGLSLGDAWLVVGALESWGAPVACLAILAGLPGPVRRRVLAGGAALLAAAFLEGVYVYHDPMPPAVAPLLGLATFAVAAALIGLRERTAGGRHERAAPDRR